MHTPNITRLMLCNDPELQLSPEQQPSELAKLHRDDPDNFGHEGESPVEVSQSLFGALHRL